MKNYIHYFLFVITSLFLLNAITGCDKKEKTENKVEGTWKIENLSTNSNALNSLLSQLLPSFPIPLNNVTLTFGSDKNLIITYPTLEGSKIIKAAYAYDDKELALRFDMIPIPFNAFGIAELENTKLTLTQTLSKSIVETILQYLIKEIPEYTLYLQAILAEIQEEGLKLDIKFIKSN
ncbi:hypothetical protein [Parabacteroides pacaensis]|uniref:hypothetical protein n=1 Tax=Parabacteroides pacaensis TaxID=2086575 RepID=UPI000D10C111|nr:hypothetical protein [Parabacteroides pacaensis]